MNEQLIQKLVDEAGLKDILADHAKKYPGIYQEPIEVFAGLIVRECIVDFYRNHLDTTSDEDITEQVDRYVKEHFGVEE